MLKEGYIGRWKKYPKHEVKIRVARPSVLVPSNELLKDFKEGRIEEYFRRVLAEKADLKVDVEVGDLREVE